MKSYLAIDAGTTAIKVLLANEKRHPLFAGEMPVSVIHREPGAAETDMALYWDTLCRLTNQAAATCPDAWMQISGVCVAGQGDGLWPLDRNGQIFMPAILWQDTRAGRYCPREDPSWLYHSNYLQPGTRGILLTWLKANRRQAYDQIVFPLGCVGFLNHRLTGISATDGSCCGDCFDILTQSHVSELYDTLGISEMFSRLPPILPCNAQIGTVTRNAAEQSAIPTGTPVYTGCLDATAAVLGRSVLRKGRVSVCAGTTLLVMCAQQEPPHFPLPEGVYADKLPYATPLYRLCFSPRSGASAIAAEKEIYAPRENYEQMYGHIAEISMGCDGLTYLPFRGGERSPFRCAQAESGYYGLRPTHTRWHRLRAVAESVLFAARHCIDASGQTFEAAELTGGAARSPVFCQMAADILGLPTEVNRGVYAGVDGCIALMCQADGMPSPADNTNSKCYFPSPDNRRQAEKAYEKYRQTIDAMLPVWKSKNTEGR